MWQTLFGGLPDGRLRTGFFELSDHRYDVRIPDEPVGSKDCDGQLWSRRVGAAHPGLEDAVQVSPVSVLENCAIARLEERQYLEQRRHYDPGRVSIRCKRLQ